VSEARDAEPRRPWLITGYHHVQLAIPPGGEEEATSFYEGILGLNSVPKPAHLAVRGGLWFRGAGLELHLGIEDGFRPSARSHPALRIEGLAHLRAGLRDQGVGVEDDTQLEGYERFYVRDPFGNRLELIEERR
jgi:catechol 2,3-dioxygenase-like lactoylglutathione lyase family enzyme